MVSAMSPKQIVEHYGDGSVHRAAKKSGVSHTTLYNWLSDGKVPDLWQVWFERDTAGTLKADVKVGARA
jgi:hypothetical protein